MRQEERSRVSSSVMGRGSMLVLVSMLLASPMVCSGEKEAWGDAGDEFQQVQSALQSALQSAIPSALDTSFSSDGKLATDFDGAGSANHYATAVALQPDGKIVVAGFVNDSELGVTRYNVNGSLDTSFSGDGKVTTFFGDLPEPNSVLVQSDGKIVVAGTVHVPNGDTNFYAVRYLANGTLDMTFSPQDGIRTVDFSGDSLDDAYGAALQADGKIVIVGGTFNDFAVLRLQTNGWNDNSFGNNGKVETNIGGEVSIGQDVAIQPDGKIVVVGFGGGFGNGGIARYLANGNLDSSFGSGGKVISPFVGGSVAIQTDGKIVVGGFADDPDRLFQFALARYLPNGTLDSSFGTGGTRVQDVGLDQGIASIAIQPDGYIVAAGNQTMARFNPSGNIDTNFDGPGWIDVNFGNSGDSFVSAIAVQPKDGRIVAVGGGDDNVTLAFGVARYHAFTCGGFGATLVGSSNDDTLVGTSRADVIAGLGGNDTISGRGSADYLCGGGRGDKISGGDGNDQLFGNSGNDVCDGGRGTDTATSCETLTNVP